jgi:coproporphyrinogen III oxidase
MADLNPALPREEDKAWFYAQIDESLGALSEEERAHMKAQGDAYFYIPSLKRHRGVAHYYLEQWRSGDAEADLALARGFGERVIDTYLAILERSFERAQALGEPTEAEREAQRAYHSAYFLQVLTLDRGTSSGLLVHNQNDAGILGSLPMRVKPELLKSWVSAQVKPQDLLLERLIDALPSVEGLSTLTRDRRCQLAQLVREHFHAHPEALKLQARGDVLPPTVAHHQGPQ